MTIMAEQIGQHWSQEYLDIVSILATPKRRHYALEWTIDKNQTQAAIRAGYSKRSASTIAKKLMDDPMMQQVIHQLESKMAERTLVTAERIKKEYARIAFASIGSVIEFLDNGTIRIRSAKEIAEDDMAAIAAVETSTFRGVTKTTIRLNNKLEALHDLAVMYDMFKTLQGADEESAAAINSLCSMIKQSREMLVDKEDA